MTAKTPLYQTEIPSTEFEPEAFLCVLGAFPTLRYSYYRDGADYRSGIRFKGALATRSRSEQCCTAWHIEGAYDTLVEISPSPWAREAQADIPIQLRDNREMHHYMIYLDSAGCFEVVAESWEIVPEEPGSWDSI